jgi:hypothetical protein
MIPNCTAGHCEVSHSILQYRGQALAWLDISSVVDFLLRSELADIAQDEGAIHLLLLQTR